MSVRFRMAVLPWLVVAAIDGCGAKRAAAADDSRNRPNQDLSRWERDKENLLWGFSNMYQPCVREIPGQGYRYDRIRAMRREIGP
jgi:hypothetical protein